MNAPGRLPLSRVFKYLDDDRFELTLNNWATRTGRSRSPAIYLRGPISWPGEHPLAAGRAKGHFVRTRPMRRDADGGFPPPPRVL